MSFSIRHSPQSIVDAHQQFAELFINFALQASRVRCCFDLRTVAEWKAELGNRLCTEDW